MKKVVFICHGNMFRSHVAQAFYNSLAKDDSLAYSYGTHVVDQGYQGKKLSMFPKLSIVFNELKKYGLDIREEHCEQLKEEYLKNADKIVVMAEREYIPEWLHKYDYEYWDGVSNPEVHTNDVIENILKIIREKVLELINQEML